MNTKQFKRLIIVLLLIGGMWMTLFFCLMEQHPDPILAIDEENATCCSEEDIITIYEGDGNLKEVYDRAMKHIIKRDSVNYNAVIIIKMWQDSLAKK